MQNKVLISVRLSPEVLAYIDKAKDHHPYWNRSSMIDHLLLALFKCQAPNAIDDILASFDPFDDGLIIRTQSLKH